jgi:hypothetical protein
MAAKRCPKCNLVNPKTASACDCGWSFVEETQTAPRSQPAHDDQARRDRRLRGTVQLLLGAFLAVSGSIGGAGPVRTGSSSVPALQSAYAAGGSFAVLAAIIGGILLIILGVRNRRG